jgi:hypothetical protein
MANRLEWGVCLDLGRTPVTEQLECRRLAAKYLSIQSLWDVFAMMAAAQCKLLQLFP